MQPLVTFAQMQEIDRRAISELGIPELLLIEHAALAVVKALVARFGGTLIDTSGIILAGVGKNGADALAVARILNTMGLRDNFVGMVGTPTALSSNTKTQIEILERLGVSVVWPKKAEPELFEGCNWVVDGFFGTGLSREVKEPYLHWIKKINEYANQKWIVSIDLPSGLHSDTGHPMPIAVMASQTVTLGFIKRGLVTGPAADYVGKLSLESIQIPRTIPFSIAAFLYGPEDAFKLPHRKPSSHKGDYGHVYVWASEENKQGACILSSLGALRTGAGRVTVVGEKETLKTLRQRLPPEIMTEEIGENIFENPKGVWIQGPGMGPEEKISMKYLEMAIKAKWRCILDADALNLLAANPKRVLPILQKASIDQLVLTPHPKEAARLLGISVSEVEEDRFQSAKKLSEKYGATVVLKGKGTLVQLPLEAVIIVTSGDTGLAKGGTGDLLCGILGAFLAQGLSIVEGVPLGVYLHGKVSERVTQTFGHSRSTLATDLLFQIPEVLRELENQ